MLRKIVVLVLLLPFVQPASNLTMDYYSTHTMGYYNLTMMDYYLENGCDLPLLHSAKHTMLAVFSISAVLGNIQVFLCIHFIFHDVCVF